MVADLIMQSMVGSLVCVLAAVSSVSGGIVRISWEAVPGTTRTENRWMHAASYADKQRTTNAVFREFRRSGILRALGGTIVDIDYVPGWWEGVSNPSVQMDLAGIDDIEANYLAAVIGKALHQDGVGFHRILGLSETPEQANLSIVSLDRQVSSADLEKLDANLRTRFPKNAWGVALIPGDKEVRVPNVSDGAIENRHILDWIKSSMVTHFAGHLRGITNYCATTGFQSEDTYDSAIALKRHRTKNILKTSIYFEHRA